MQAPFYANRESMTNWAGSLLHAFKRLTRRATPTVGLGSSKVSTTKPALFRYLAHVVKVRCHWGARTIPSVPANRHSKTTGCSSK